MTIFISVLDAFKESPYFLIYSTGLALTTPKYFLDVLTTTSGVSHWINTFLTGKTGSCTVGACLKMTFLFWAVYGSHRSTMTDCGLSGSGAIRSIITLRGGGGKWLPDIVINLRPIAGGGGGGASRNTIGSGVFGFGGCYCLFIKIK